MKIAKNIFLIIIALILLPLWMYFLIAMFMQIYFGTIPSGVMAFISSGFSDFFGSPAGSPLSHFLFPPLVVFSPMIVLCFTLGRLRTFLKMNGIVLLIGSGLLTVASVILHFIIDTTAIDRDMAALAASVPQQFAGTPAEIANGFYQTVLFGGLVVACLSVSLVVFSSKIGPKQKKIVTEQVVEKPTPVVSELPQVEKETAPVVQPQKKVPATPETPAISATPTIPIKKTTVSMDKAVAKAQERPAETDALPDKTAKSEMDRKTFFKKIAAPGMRIIAGIIAAIISYAISASFILALWAFIFPMVTLLFEKQLDVFISRIMPWKKKMKKVFLFITGITAPALFALLLTLLLNGIGLGNVSAVLLVFIVPPFSYLIGRKPAAHVKEA